jgi:hypothetical protein
MENKWRAANVPELRRNFLERMFNMIAVASSFRAVSKPSEVAGSDPREAGQLVVCAAGCPMAGIPNGPVQCYWNSCVNIPKLAE